MTTHAKDHQETHEHPGAPQSGGFSGVDPDPRTAPRARHPMDETTRTTQEQETAQDHRIGEVRTRYVCGFLFADDQVLLIEKQRPAWQRDSWNGVGGKIEPGESDAEAMRREFREETGIDTELWEHFATLGGEDFEVVFFRAQAVQVLYVTQGTDERPAWWPVADLPRVIPNLLWLIPMALHETSGRGMPFRISERAVALPAPAPSSPRAEAPAAETEDAAALDGLLARLTPDVVSAVGAASTWTGSESETAALYEAVEVVTALAALRRAAPGAAPEREADLYAGSVSKVTWCIDRVEQIASGRIPPDEAADPGALPVAQKAREQLRAALRRATPAPTGERAGGEAEHWTERESVTEADVRWLRQANGRFAQQVEEMRQLLTDARECIVDAIYGDDGLDASEGEPVIARIVAALNPPARARRRPAPVAAPRGEVPQCAVLACGDRAPDRYDSDGEPLCERHFQHMMAVGEDTWRASMGAAPRGTEGQDDA